MEPSIPNISLSFIKSIAFVHLQSVEQESIRECKGGVVTYTHPARPRLYAFCVLIEQARTATSAKKVTMPQINSAVSNLLAASVYAKADKTGYMFCFNKRLQTIGLIRASQATQAVRNTDCVLDVHINEDFTLAPSGIHQLFAGSQRSGTLFAIPAAHDDISRDEAWDPTEQSAEQMYYHIAAYKNRIAEAKLRAAYISKLFLLG